MGDLPPALALWLIGLGIEVHWNRPRHCQANGIVERDHGVLAQWAELERCPDYASGAARLSWACQMQRESYPALDGQSRAAVYPSLFSNPRRYTPDEETAQWDLRRVGQVLARGAWSRKVDQTGTISIYNWPYRVGRAYAGQAVTLRFDAATWTWVVRDRQGQLMGRYAATELTQERICGLDVSRKKP